MLPLVVVLALAGCCLASRQPSVVVEQGQLRGTTLLSAGGRQFAAFRGVPYARPPVGKRRFKESEPAQQWHGVWDATHYSSPCLQYLFTHFPEEPRIIGEEDCLYVNIFTPKLPQENQQAPLLDVFVYIHGGGFMSGAGSIYGPEYLMDRDVVYVTFNYRLGILGFLSLEDELLPGNNGLKDQSSALRWIKKNIAAFGGNPASITITGSSAGGASVHFHYLSPHSKGLFQKGISFSGSSLVPWAMTEAHREKALKLANLVGCEMVSSKDILQCLKARPARQLVEMTAKFQVWRYNPFTPFGPTVEVAGKNPFLNKHPAQLLVEGSVQNLPWVTSVTTEEGNYPAADFVADAVLMKELESRFIELSPHLLDFNYTAPQHLHPEIGRRVLKHYLGSKQVSTDTAMEVIKIFGDRIFVADVERAARMQSKVNTAPVYFYVFGYRGKYSLSKIMSKTDINLGVSHGDDIEYITDFKDAFGISALETEEDKRMMNLMLDICLNFAKTGNPTPPGRNVVWPVVKKDSKDLNFLRISSADDLKPDSSPDLGEIKFWDSLGIQEPQIMLYQRKHNQDEL